jgi:hypothetical protein
MSMMKKKNRKAMRKTVKKLINNYGPTVVAHLGTALASSLAAYATAEPDHKRKKHLKKLKKMPRKIADAIRDVPGVAAVAEQVVGGNGSHRKTKRSHAAGE